jgi:hypothetical protein
LLCSSFNPLEGRIGTVEAIAVKRAYEAHSTPYIWPAVEAWSYRSGRRQRIGERYCQQPSSDGGPRGAPPCAKTPTLIAGAQVPPKGFHRIRHYGLLTSAGCKANIARAKELMAAPMSAIGARSA